MKTINRIVSFLLVFMLTSCYTDIEKNSLDDYIDQININGIGFSDYEIDHPDYFLPSNKFIEDYEYISGKYYFYEEDPFRWSKKMPSTSFLRLSYDKLIYPEAKEFMISKIFPYYNKLYFYNDYVFFVNEAFMVSLPSPIPKIPKWFTMACYNDFEQILIFIGFFDYSPGIDDKFYEDFEGNFLTFIDTYYGNQHNFNKFSYE